MMMTRRQTIGFVFPALVAFPRAKHAVFVELSGGMSHVETFDYKLPHSLAPEFDPVRLSPDFTLSHRLFPRLSSRFHRLAVVRSVTSDAQQHFPAQLLLRHKATLFDTTAAVGCRLNASLPGPLGLRNLQPSPAGLSPADRSCYGSSMLGASCATTRDLLRRPCAPAYIHVCHPGWDHHGAILSPGALPRQCAELDSALASLIDDLTDHGLLDRTLLVAMSEFGRTPGGLNAMGGRDHHTACFPALFAGAGVRGGAIVGRTDEEGRRVIDTGWDRARTPHVRDVMATIRWALGADTSGGEVIRELFATPGSES